MRAPAQALGLGDTRTTGLRLRTCRFAAMEAATRLVWLRSDLAAAAGPRLGSTKAPARATAWRCRVGCQRHVPAPPVRPHDARARRETHCPFFWIARTESSSITRSSIIDSGLVEQLCGRKGGAGLVSNPDRRRRRPPRRARAPNLRNIINRDRACVMRRTAKWKLGEIFPGFHRFNLQPNQKAFIHVIENLSTFAHHQRSRLTSLGRAGSSLVRGRSDLRDTQGFDAAVEVENAGYVAQNDSQEAFRAKYGALIPSALDKKARESKHIHWLFPPTLKSPH
jgi:hypothetical protein